MFAVVRTGGKQYRVAPDTRITVERLPGAAGDRVELDVLLVADDGVLKSGNGLKATAEILAQNRGEKVIVFKKKRRHNYRRKRGHRQPQTVLRILSIG
ncbi:MAG: 50S ribosomal protein L21 [Sphingomonadaceae bacterium]|uniref:50S ribosomal protein L21 n=1 Tax=Thermaurantiacus sp. TaxID=2820283 RepID=UPI00298EF750|nr:50S ribosomal protein L21 [Thermaurantiacus sp.]MCS6987060.1 50S ribosomal protein L21 [Sphingomonadaceae bacterium]MDW8415602.1 50S ribosomal protein L21 [Thermaurantiacus sp.]